MPEFEELLTLVQKLRLTVPQHQPRALARMLADAKYTQFEAEDVAQLFNVLYDVVEEIHGAAGARAFQQEYVRILRQRSGRG